MIHPIFIAMPTDITIWLIEDEAAIADTLIYALQTEGYAVRWFERGQLMLDALAHTQPALLILDIGLPDINGFEVCRQVLARYDLPLLFLTARAEEVDRIVGLEMGADDYVAKPVQPRVLLARIRALLRRTDKTPEDEVLQRIEFDDLVIDNGGRSVTLNGELVDFTSAEYDLLWLLASNAGRILSREDIFERLRGIEYDGQDRSIDVRISRIRPKIGDDPENPKRIKTVRSKGYLFVKETNGI